MVPFTEYSARLDEAAKCTTKLPYSIGVFVEWLKREQVSDVLPVETKYVEVCSSISGTKKDGLTDSMLKLARDMLLARQAEDRYEYQIGHIESIDMANEIQNEELQISVAFYDVFRAQEGEYAGWRKTHRIMVVIMSDGGASEAHHIQAKISPVVGFLLHENGSMTNTIIEGEGGVRFG